LKNDADFDIDAPIMEIEVKGLVELGLDEDNINSMAKNKYNISSFKGAANTVDVKNFENLDDSIELIGEDEKKSKKRDAPIEKSKVEENKEKSTLKTYCFMGEIIADTNQLCGFISGNTRIPFFQGI